MNPKGNSTNPSNWDFGSSFFFAGTVVTTIGKGSGEEGLGFPHSPCLGFSFPKADAETRLGLSRRRFQKAQIEKWKSETRKGEKAIKFASMSSVV